MIPYPYKHSVEVASLTGVSITSFSPTAIAWHAGAEGPPAGGISVVARGTPLTELPPVSRRALAALHPGSAHSGDRLCRHQGDVVQVAGAWREVQPVSHPHPGPAHVSCVTTTPAGFAAPTVAVLLNLVII